MKQLERFLVGILLVVAAGIVVHAPLTVWLGTVWPEWSEVIKAWKELLMAVALVLLVVLAVRRKMADTLLRDRVIQLALVFAGIHFLMIGVFNNDLHAAGAGILNDLRFVLYFVLTYGTLRLFPQYRSLFVKVFIGGAAVVFGFALLQLFVLPKDILAHIGYGKQTIAPYLTVDQNPNYVRINSTLRGPNPLGAYAMIVLSFLMACTVKYGQMLRYNHRLWLIGATVTGGLIIGTSYSRSSLLAVIVAIAVIVMATATKKVRRRLSIVTLVSVAAAVVLVFALRDNAVVSNVVLHDDPAGGGSVSSNDDHASSVVDGIKRFAVQPFGAGVGSTGSASLSTDKPLIIENQFLFIAHEVGWVGLGVFLWLFVEIMRRLWQRRASMLALGTFASGCGLAIIGLMQPVWVDDTVGIIWYGLAGVAIASELGAAKLKRKRQ